MFQTMKQHVAVHHRGQHNYVWEEIKFIKEKLTAARLILWS